MRKLLSAAALIVALAISSACSPSNDEAEMKHSAIIDKASALRASFSRCPYLESGGEWSSLRIMLIELGEEDFGSKEWMQLADVLDQALDHVISRAEARGCM